MVNQKYPQFDNEYFRKKARESRQRNPLSQKKRVYVVHINGKKYAVLHKNHIKIDTIAVSDYKKATDIIQCF